MGSPVSALQTWAVPSADAVATRRPSALNAAVMMVSLCGIGAPTGIPVAGFHTCAAWTL